MREGLDKYIKITSGLFPQGSAKVSTSEGVEIKGIRSCDIRMRAGDICTATMELNVNNIEIKAHPLLAFDTICEAAKCYGYDLIPILDYKKSITKEPK